MVVGINRRFLGGDSEVLRAELGGSWEVIVMQRVVGAGECFLKKMSLMTGGIFRSCA